MQRICQGSEVSHSLCVALIYHVVLCFKRTLLHGFNDTTFNIFPTQTNIIANKELKNIKTCNQFTTTQQIILLFPFSSNVISHKEWRINWIFMSCRKALVSSNSIPFSPNTSQPIESLCLFWLLICYEHSI